MARVGKMSKPHLDDFACDSQYRYFCHIHMIVRSLLVDRPRHLFFVLAGSNSPFSGKFQNFRFVLFVERENILRFLAGELWFGF